MAISAKAVQARESARQKSGEFGTQPHAESDVVLEMPQEEVHYSFLEEQFSWEDRTEADFEGVPSRFATADIRGKLILFDGENVPLWRLSSERDAIKRFSAVLSEPKDFATSDEDARALMEKLGIEVTGSVTGGIGLGIGNGVTRAWVGEYEGQQVVVADRALNSKNLTIRSWRRMDEQGEAAGLRRGKIFTSVDLRTLAGLSRLDRLTESEGVFTDMALGPTLAPSDFAKEGEEHKVAQDRWAMALLMRKAAVAEAAVRLEDEQVRLRGVVAQKKRLGEQGKKIATAFMDKKNPSKAAQQMMENTSLRSSFPHVEIDNDVSPGELADFEKAWDEAKKKLPPIPVDRAPTLRIRKLGKHRANGVYSPAHNTVAIDVRTSEAMVHEMGHYFDLAVHGSASLSRDFAPIVRDYTKALKPDPGVSGAKVNSYYGVPTEVLARGFEVYAHERLEVSGRVVKPEKFDRFDYAPITQNPELKERMFTFFDKTFGR